MSLSYNGFIVSHDEVMDMPLCFDGGLSGGWYFFGGKQREAGGNGLCVLGS